MVYEYNRVIVSINLRRCDLRGYFLCRASVETVRRCGVAAGCKQLQNVDYLQTPERDWVRNQCFVGINIAYQYQLLGYLQV